MSEAQNEKVVGNYSPMLEKTGGQAEDIFSTIVDYRWSIGLIVLFAGLIGVFRGWSIVPLYKGDALIEVHQAGKQVAGVETLSFQYIGGSSSAGEMEILRSRSVVGQAVDQFQLDVVAEPIYFPFVGRAMAARQDSSYSGVAPALWGAGEYGWGGEEMRVGRLNLPDGIGRAAFNLVAGEDGKYDLYSTSQEILLSGRVGQLEAAPFADGEMSILVAHLQARPGTHFTLVKQDRENVIRNYQSRLQIAEKAHSSGIVEVALLDTDKERLKHTLNALANAYVRQNIEQINRDTQSQLDFLDRQIPVTRSHLEAAEKKYSDYRLKHGDVAWTIDSRALIDSVTTTEQELAQLKLDRRDLLRRYTKSHPVVKSFERRYEAAKQSFKRQEKRLQRLPGAQQQYATLEREVDVSEQLYSSLLSRKEGLQVLQAGSTPTVRILDDASISPSLVSADPRKTFMISLVIGFLAAIAQALIRRKMDQSIDDPSVIESQLGVPVACTVPHSREQVRLSKLSTMGESSVLTIQASKDLAVEGIRSLRSNLRVVMPQARNNVVLVTGISPSVGKTFLSLNLAYVLAEAGQRVALVDADLHRGRLHKGVGVAGDPGVTSVLLGEAEVKQTMVSDESGNLTLIPVGTLDQQASQLLLGDRFEKMIKELSDEFDVVIVDSPPVLALNDAAVIGAHCGTTLVVSRAGHNSLKQIEIGCDRLEKAGVENVSVVFNDVSRFGNSYFGAARYRYYYQYK